MQDSITQAQLLIDLLLNHDENCRNCCIRDIFKQIENMEGGIPSANLPTKSTSDSDR